MPARTPQERSLIARRAAQTRWAKQDPAKHAAKMRLALEDRWIDQVDPDRTLTETERFRRAQSARKAFYTGLALKSAQARRARKSA